MKTKLFLIPILFLLSVAGIKAQPVVEDGVLVYWKDPPADVVIPEGVTTLGGNVFSGYKHLIKSVHFPASLQNLGVGEWGWVLTQAKLERITVDANSPHFSSDDNVLFNKDKTKLVAYAIGNTRTAYTIPASVKYIEECAFYDCPSLTNVVVPAGVETIEKGTFNACKKLSSVTLPNSVKRIEKNAFNCLALTNFQLPASLEYIGFSAFSGAPFTELTFPNTLKTIESSAFAATGLKNVTLPNSLTQMGTWAFSRCRSLVSVSIPAGIKSIAQAAFKDCDGLQNVTIAEGIEAIGESCFQKCSSLKQITLPNSLKKIGRDAFSSAGLEQLHLPDGLQVIESGAFSQCRFATINIPTSMDNTGDGNAFGECSNLTSVVFHPNVKTISYATFAGCTNLKEVSLPNSVTTIGGAAFSWTGIKSINMPGVIKIGNEAFSHCFELTQFTVPSTVTFIGARAFEYCNNLSSISIPNSVTFLGNFAFDHCVSLKSITIPNSITTLNGGLFHLCENLTEINIPASVTTIRDTVFAACESLPPTFSLPKTVKTLGHNSFSYCHGLKDVISLDNATKIPYQQFHGSEGLEEITIPEGIETIDIAAFEDCINLRKVHFPSTLKLVDYLSFAKTNIESVVFPDAVLEVDELAFLSCKNLRKATFGKNLKNFDLDAFAKCVNLVTLDFSGVENLEAMDLNAFSPESFNESLTFYLPNDKFKDQIEKAGYKVVIGKPANDPVPISFKDFKATLSNTSVTLSVTLVSETAVTLKECGFVISTNKAPSISDKKIVSATTALGEITGEYKELQANSTYYMRAFATDKNDFTSYSEEIYFTVPAGKPAPAPVFLNIPDTINVNTPVALSMKEDMYKVFDNGTWKINDTPVSGGTWVTDKPGIYFIKVTSADGKTTVERRVVVK